MTDIGMRQIRFFKLIPFFKSYCELRLSTANNIRIISGDVLESQTSFSQSFFYYEEVY